MIRIRYLAFAVVGAITSACDDPHPDPNAVLGGQLIDCACNCAAGPDAPLGDIREAWACASPSVPGQVQQACQIACTDLGGLCFQIGGSADGTCPVQVGQSRARLTAGGVASSSDLQIDKQASLASIKFNDEQKIVHVAGFARFTGGECSGNCPLTLNVLRLEPDPFSIAGLSVNGVRIINDNALDGVKSGVNLSIDRTKIHVIVDGTVDGVLQSSVFFPDPGQETTGFYDPATGEMELTGTFFQQGGAGELSFDLRGGATARTPIANAGPDQTLTCDPTTGTALATLDGSGSRDPDNNLDRIFWFEGTQRLDVGTVISASFATGSHTIVASAVDTTNKTGSDTVVITVRDTAPPEIVPRAATIAIDVCIPGPQEVDLAVPDVVDACTSGPNQLTGQITLINGSPVNPPIDVTDGKVTLPTGTHVVRWTATNPNGNTAHLDQTIEIREAATTACCSAGQVVVLGTPGRDFIEKEERPVQSYCVLGLGGNDHLETETRGNFIAGGDGNDDLEARGGDDVLVGGAGDDELEGGFSGTLKAYGGAGDDEIEGEGNDSAIIFGNAGDDLILGSPGDDDIVPGPGKDRVFARGGNDRVTIFNVCEVSSGELLDGGLGSDTLITPVPVSVLRAMGVVVIGFETVIVDTTQSALSECF